MPVRGLTSYSVTETYSDDESEFLRAMDRYKTDNHRPFPTCQEVLAVIRSLGYRRVADPVPLPVVGSPLSQGID